MSIQVKNVSKLYGTQRALDNVSFDVETGQIVGFLGPNGAGKSTMMKIITCFIPPTQGEVRVNGHDVMEDSIAVRKHVGYLPEHNPLYLEMYVKEYLEFCAQLHKLGNIRQRVKEMIDMTGLGVEQHKKIGALSKGYRQRVGLAQALIHDPSVLILDEPTSGLDPNQLTEIRSLIRKLGKEKTVMLSTHIMQEVEALCDRVIIINRGNIVADSKPEELQALNAGAQVLVVEFAREVTAEKIHQLPAVTAAKQINSTTWEIETRAGQDIRPDVFKLAVSLNTEVLTLQRTERKLEDIFRELTAGRKK